MLVSTGPTVRKNYGRLKLAADLTLKEKSDAQKCDSSGFDELADHRCEFGHMQSSRAVSATVPANGR